MKRSTVHIGFSAACLSLLPVLIIQWLLVAEGRAVARELERVSRTPISASDSALPAAAAKYAETRLAWANALSAGGRFDQAEALYNDLIQHADNRLIAQAAQFNLANLYLRQAMLPGMAATRIRPLLELAKLRYRDLLGELPTHWDARYNLERALRLAPEDAAIAQGDKGDPIKSVRVIVPDFKAKDLP